MVRVPDTPRQLSQGVCMTSPAHTGALREKKSSVVSLKTANSACLLPQGESTVIPVGQLGSEAHYFFRTRIL